MPDREMSEADSKLFYDLAERLRLAHRRVASLPEGAHKASISRRLLAISDAAKHDLEHASRRLDRLLRDLHAEHAG